ncbi:MAG: Ig-like domain-containing protein [Rubricoccaceae bacterium]|nr:Ig-like domain-containing protein [Rubricoccaceae bacterium]
MFRCFTLIFGIVGILWGCATPIRPSGGPVDSIPPSLVRTEPENGAVRVESNQFVLHFSERLDEGTATQAVTITPFLTPRPQIRGRGNRIEIDLPDTLRSETTYVITIGTTLRDEHGVALSSPISVAFSTGDMLDTGEISGRLRDPETRAGVAGFRVFAYRMEDEEAPLPDPRTELPSYQTETASDGSFHLTYLHEGPYFVIALEDRNRNQLADSEELFAVSRIPVHHARARTVDSTATDQTNTLQFFVAERDTIPPQLRSLRPLSSQRFTLVFSEPLAPVYYPDTQNIRVRSSGVSIQVEEIYQRSSDSTRVELTSKVPVTGDSLTIEITEGGVYDLHGNTTSYRSTIQLSDTLPPDTLSLRFEGFLPPSRTPADSIHLLRPDQQPGVAFNMPLEEARRDSLLTLIGPDGEFETTFETANGTVYWLTGAEDDSHPLPTTFTVQISMPDSTYRRRFVLPTADALGSISGTVSYTGDQELVVLAYPEQGGPYRTTVNEEGMFSFSRLEPGSYRLRFHEAHNGQSWFGGQIYPHRPPGLLRWLEEPIRVRARWDYRIEETVDLAD